MATIYLKLSKRVQKDTQKSEIILRVRNGNDYDLLVKSGLFITPDNFKDGNLVVNRRKIGNDIKYHEEVETKLSGLKNHILNSINETGKSRITKEWLNDLVGRYVHPERYEEQKELSVYEFAEKYLAQHQFSYDHIKGFRVLVRAIARYEGYRRYELATDLERKKLAKVLSSADKFTFDPKTISKDDIEDFRDYLRNEKELSEENRPLFDLMLANYPANIKSGHHEIEGRGENAVIKLMKKMKAFFNWLSSSEGVVNRPFDNVKIGLEKYGEPFYISITERNQIASTPMPTKHLEVQRDIFVAHCFLGCRVGDLVKLTEKNIVDGILIYTPHKTKDEGDKPTVARVPLHPKAVDLINKYKGVDKKGRLFPFISPQKYNDAIKEIFTIAGITRNVEIRDAKTGETEMRPINEVASSHLARRTFIGSVYSKVADPNIICKMSGHVEGSKAFTRYRNVDDNILKGAINTIGN